MSDKVFFNSPVKARIFNFEYEVVDPQNKTVLSLKLPSGAFEEREYAEKVLNLVVSLFNGEAYIKDSSIEWVKDRPQYMNVDTKPTWKKGTLKMPEIGTPEDTFLLGAPLISEKQILEEHNGPRIVEGDKELNPLSEDEKSPLLRNVKMSKTEVVKEIVEEVSSLRGDTPEFLQDRMKEGVGVVGDEWGTNKDKSELFEIEQVTLK